VSGRGWSSQGLKAVGDDDTLWTVADAARLLGTAEKRMSAEKVRHLIDWFDLEPVGKRRTTPYGTSGRYARVYNSIDLIKAHDRLSRGDAERR
jgi:hypothetical protein